MRAFDSPPEALAYVVAFLIPKQQGYIVNFYGPGEEQVLSQIVDQQIVFEDDELGLTLFLPFQDTPDFLESFNMLARRDEFDDVTQNEIPSYAMRFNTDVRAALHMLATVLDEVYGYPPLTHFKCEIEEH